MRSLKNDAFDNRNRRRVMPLMRDRHSQLESPRIIMCRVNLCPWCPQRIGKDFDLLPPQGNSQCLVNGFLRRPSPRHLSWGDAILALLVRENPGDEARTAHGPLYAGDFNDVHTKPNDHREKYATFREE